MIAAKRVYEPISRVDGTRVLVMRLWPRGISKGEVDVWLRELGPVVPLLRAFRGGRIDWPAYRRRYLAGLRRPEAQAALREVRTLAGRGRVTLLCGCANPARCHRTLLARYLGRRAKRRVTARRSRRSSPTRGAPRPRSGNVS